MPIPLFVNDTQLTPSREAILGRISAVVAAGRFILGPEVKAFEAELADYVGVAHAVGVANGTDAITIAARALGVEAGDEVVLPAFTFYATAEAIASIGARAGFLRRGPRHPQPHPGNGCGGLDAADQGDRGRRPVRQPGAAAGTA